MKNLGRLFILLFGLVIFLSACVTPATSSPTPRALTQQLRLVNRSKLLLHNLIVRFPEDQISFGDVPGGTPTAYRDVPSGVYRYAAYEVEVNGTKYDQPVIDWVGEVPMGVSCSLSDKIKLNCDTGGFDG